MNRFCDNCTTLGHQVRIPIPFDICDFFANIVGQWLVRIYKNYFMFEWMALHWFCTRICVDIEKAKNQKWQVKTNIWKSLNNFVTIVHRSSKSKSNFALPAVPICQEVFLWQNQILSKRPLNQAVWLATTVILHFMISDIDSAFRSQWFIRFTK